MNMKTALIGSFAAAAALVAVSADANARSWHYRSTACGPSATIIKHHRYGFVGSERDYGVRSRTSIRSERFGYRGGHDRIGVSVRERGGVHANINARVRGGEDRQGARMSGNERNAGAGAGNATGRSVSPSGTSNAGSSGGAMSSSSGKSGGGAGG
ncbi:MAG: hypothetical protein JO004_08040, partial [Methylobacteriaceae bacterium]|nr:hypothetical protein [Methylobacteriaceae bacterium]